MGKKLNEGKKGVRSKVAVEQHFLPIEERTNTFKEVNLAIYTNYYQQFEILIKDFLPEF